MRRLAVFDCCEWRRPNRRRKKWRHKPQRPQMMLSLSARQSWRALRREWARNDRRRAYEGKTAEVRVSLQEPEAVNQRTKDKMRRLAYKPVVLANADKLIVGQRVEPSNEILAIEPMVGQQRLAEAHSGIAAKTETALPAAE